MMWLIGVLGAGDSEHRWTIMMVVVGAIVVLGNLALLVGV